MYGSVVQAALSPDGQRQAATLYRDTVKPEHTGFVHLLALESGLTVCIDLHEPFGSAGFRATFEAIEVARTGRWRSAIEPMTPASR